MQCVREADFQAHEKELHPGSPGHLYTCDGSDSILPSWPFRQSEDPTSSLPVGRAHPISCISLPWLVSEVWCWVWESGWARVRQRSPLISAPGWSLFAQRLTCLVVFMGCPLWFVTPCVRLLPLSSSALMRGHGDPTDTSGSWTTFWSQTFKCLQGQESDFFNYKNYCVVVYIGYRLAIL